VSSAVVYRPMCGPVYDSMLTAVVYRSIVYNPMSSAWYIVACADMFWKMCNKTVDITEPTYVFYI
jgi:hypothetical protein